MSPALAMAAIVTLAALLAVASAAAGALWWRVRATPGARAARLADELADRLKALEAIAARLDGLKPARSGKSPAPSHPIGPLTLRRVDHAEATAVAGPTLIAVPDLAAPAADPPASAELERRFGALWELADSGATAEAIARATGQPIGQVELILGLRRQRAAGGRA